MQKYLIVAVCGLALAVIVHPAAAQCVSATSVETVAGNGVLGRIENGAYGFHRARANSTAVAITDDTTISINTNNTDGLPTRTYEFDVDNSGVAAGNVPVPLSSADLGLGIPVFNVRAARALVAAINADPLSPVISDTYPFGDDQYITHMWKTDGGYFATNARGGSSVSNNAINAPPTLNYIGRMGNPAGPAFRSFVFVHGTDMNVGTTPVVRLVKSDDPGVTTDGFVTRRSPELLTCHFGIHTVNIGTVAAPNVIPGLPEGTYDLVIEQAGCEPVTFAGAIKVVMSMLDDATFNTNVLGNAGSINWQGLTDWLCPVWQNNNPLNDENPVSPGTGHLEAAKKGNLFFPLQENPTRVSNPRQLPLPTGVIETNAYIGANTGGDNECGSLRFPMASGRRQMWQIIHTNFADDTFATLTGLWTGGTTSPDEPPFVTLTYGVEIRQGDENGDILAQTTPAQATGRFNWYAFSEVVTLPGGPQDLAVVVYGENSDAVDAGLHVDELLLRVGADLWPDVDGDGDVDSADFASVQRCAAGPGAGLVTPACSRFDRDGDLDVDEADVTEFVHCSTGPGVPVPAGDVPANCSL